MRCFLAVLVAIVLWIVVWSVAVAVPVRPELPAEKATPGKTKPVPDLRGHWRGDDGSDEADLYVVEIRQEGRQLVFLPGAQGSWQGSGWVRDDGSVLIWWDIDGRMRSVSIHRLQEDGSLTGIWGWLPATEVVGGKLINPAGFDRLQRLPPVAAEIR